MTHTPYHENLPRGNAELPLEYYHVDSRHPRYQMDCHWHNEWELIHVRSGSFVLTRNGSEEPLSAGDTVLISGGQLHAGFASHCVYDCVVFDSGLFSHLAEPYLKYLSPIFDGTSVTPLHFSAENALIRYSVERLLDASSDGNPLIVFGALLDLFGRIGTCAILPSVPSHRRREAVQVRRLKRVLEYIERHYAEPISLNNLSDAAKMSPKYFCRFFRQMTQRTPMEYLNGFRIERACEELTASDKSETEIALDCGFNDISYFIKTFRRYKGVTPGKYIGSLN